MIIEKKEVSSLKNKKRFPIGMEKLRNMYRPSLWKLKKERREDWLVKWSIIWRVVVFLLCVWGGYELAVLWHSNFPESFLIKWIAGLVGAEIGAVVCLLIIIIPMDKRRKKR